MEQSKTLAQSINRFRTLPFCESVSFLLQVSKTVATWSGNLVTQVWSSLHELIKLLVVSAEKSIALSKTSPLVTAVHSAAMVFL